MFRVLASSDKRFACNASASGDLLRRLFLGGFLSGYWIIAQRTDVVFCRKLRD